jgi:catechol 2,3-dioxygenase-like lactoylglutathione lyase family enzyme
MSDRFHHLSIAPADWEATVAFYRDTLGWAVSRSWGGRGMPRGSILSGGGVKVVVVERDGAANGEPVRPRLHLDIHDIDRRFETSPAGADVVTPPQDTPWGTRWFVLRDPDGNLIAFEELHRNGG